MKITPLPFETVALTGFTHKVSIFASDCTAAALTQTFTVFPDGSADGYNQQTGLPMADSTLNSLPAGFTVEKVTTRLVTPFSGTGVTAINATVGDKANATRYVTAAQTDLMTANGVGGTNSKDVVASATTYAFSSNDITNNNGALTATINTTGANVSLLGANGVGQFDILLALSDPSEQQFVTGT
jgi:hypothetical protein